MTQEFRETFQGEGGTNPFAPQSSFFEHSSQPSQRFHEIDELGDPAATAATRQAAVEAHFDALLDKIVNGLQSASDEYPAYTVPITGDYLVANFDESAPSSSISSSNSGASNALFVVQVVERAFNYSVARKRDNTLDFEFQLVRAGETTEYVAFEVGTGGALDIGERNPHPIFGELCASDSETWDIDNPPADTAGVEVTLQRVSVCDGFLRVFSRQLKFDSKGSLYEVGAETEEVQDCPDCPSSPSSSSIVSDPSISTSSSENSSLSSASSESSSLSSSSSESSSLSSSSSESSSSSPSDPSDFDCSAPSCDSCAEYDEGDLVRVGCTLYRATCHTEDCPPSDMWEVVKDCCPSNPSSSLSSSISESSNPSSAISESSNPSSASSESSSLSSSSSESSSLSSSSSESSSLSSSSSESSNPSSASSESSNPSSASSESSNPSSSNPSSASSESSNPSSASSSSYPSYPSSSSYF